MKYGRTSVYLTRYCNRNRTFEYRFNESVETTYDYLIYHRWYRYQYLFAVVIGCEYRFPILLKSMNSIVAVYRRYGTQSDYHKRSMKDFIDCMIFSGSDYMSIRIFHSDIHVIRYYDLKFLSYRIRIQQYYRGIEIARR